MDEKRKQAMLKEINELEAPEAPPQIEWDKPSSILVEFRQTPNYRSNKLEHVIVDGVERTLWTTPTQLRSQLLKAEIQDNDTIGIKYHGTETTGDGYEVKIFTVKNFGIVK